MSDEDSETTIEVRGLDKLIKLMGQKMPEVRVGILGQKASRNAEAGSSGGLNNAEVGAFAEYGNGDKQRSFLRVPITDNLEKKMESSGAFDQDVLNEAMASASFIPYMKKIAGLAEECVDDAFETGGNGKWKPSNMKRKKVKQTLVETQQLRRSITSEVKE